MADRDPTTAFAEEAAKQLVKSVYGDLFQPAAREVGAELGEFVRAVMVAGRGFGYVIRETYEPFVLRALRSVPLERRALPPPPLLGRILEGVTYEPADTPLHEMYERLLSASMDAERVHLVHPSYPILLGRLCSDEVRILTILYEGDISGDWTAPVIFTEYLNPPFDHAVFGLGVPSAFDIYYSNIASMDLAMFEIDTDNIGDGRERRGRRRLALQLMGQRLMAACIPPLDP